MGAANALIQRLLPKDKRFFPLFESFGVTVQQAAEAYGKLLRATDPTTQTTPMFFNTTQQTFKVWNTVSGKYVAITDNLAGDIKFTATAVG